MCHFVNICVYTHICVICEYVRYSQVYMYVQHKAYMHMWHTYMF